MALPRLVPVIVTLVPVGPLVGFRLAIVGVGMTVKFVALAALPPGVVTLIAPVLAPNGTLVEMVESDVTLKLAAVPAKLTAVAPVKLVPVIFTLKPIGPETGVKLVIAGDTVKTMALVAVPEGVVTLTYPVVAPTGTAVII